MIIFIYGAETYRSKRKLQEIKAKFLKEVDTTGSSLVVLDGITLTMDQMNAAIAPASLFSRRRLIVIERIFANKTNIFNDLAEYFVKHQPVEPNAPAAANENIIVFWDDLSDEEVKKLPKNKEKFWKLLSQNKLNYHFGAMTSHDMAAWIKQEVETRGGSISLHTASVLAAIVGPDLWQISNEIDKLINFKAGEKMQFVEGTSAEIKNEDVEKFVSGQFNDNVFVLTDALGRKNKAETIKLIEAQLESGTDTVYLLAMMLRQFKILLQVKSGLDANSNAHKIATDSGLQLWVVNKVMSQVRNFTTEGLRSIYNYLVEADSLVKTGKIDPRLVFGLLTSKI